MYICVVVSTYYCKEGTPISKNRSQGEQPFLLKPQSQISKEVIRSVYPILDGWDNLRGISPRFYLIRLALLLLCCPFSRVLTPKPPPPSSRAAMMQPPPPPQWAMGPPPPPQYFQAGPPPPPPQYFQGAHPPAAMWGQPPPPQAAPPPAPAGGAAGDEVRTLWIGDLQFWMEENYLYNCFSQAGEVTRLSLSTFFLLLLLMVMLCFWLQNYTLCLARVISLASFWVLGKKGGLFISYVWMLSKKRIF